MYDYLKRMYDLLNELIQFNAKQNTNYDVGYIKSWILLCREEEIPPNEFYATLEHEYNYYKLSNNEVYHTIAMMLIYC